MKLVKKTKIRILWITIPIVIIAAAAVFFYFRQYKTVPEFVMPLIPDFEMPTTGDNIIIFAPHPDDETLACAGLISQAEQKGINVIVVLVTNGDQHRFTTIEEFKKIYPTAQNYIQSGYTRQAESKKALAGLGLKEENIIFLGYPDLDLRELADKNWAQPFNSPYIKTSSSPYDNSYHKDVVYTGENLENDIVKILNQYLPKIVIVTNPFDSHSDHAATAEFVKKALTKIDQKPQLYSYLIHFNNFPNPEGLHKNRPLTPPIKLISLSDGWFKINLDEQTESLKEKAIAEYKSQLSSRFLKTLMQSFIRQNELLSKIAL